MKKLVVAPKKLGVALAKTLAVMEGIEEGVQGHRFGYWLQLQGLTFVRQRKLVERAIGVEHDQKPPPS